MVHATEEALVKALPILSRDFGIKNTSGIDFPSLKLVKGLRSPSPSASSEEGSHQLESAPLYTFTMHLDPKIRGPLIGSNGKNLRSLYQDLQLPTYPAIDHKSILHLLGSQQQIENIISTIERLLSPHWTDYLPALDPKNLREVCPQGEPKDWRVFVVKLSESATDAMQSRAMASTDWLTARFDVYAIRLTRHSTGMTGDLFIHVSCLLDLLGLVLCYFRERKLRQLI